MPTFSQNVKNVEGFIGWKIVVLGVHFVMGWGILRINVGRRTKVGIFTNNFL
jgi:hypothetical protein